MKEILAANLDKAVEELGLKAIKTYESIDKEYEQNQIWELSDADYETICNIKDDDWKERWGWWRSAEGSTMGAYNPIHRYKIKGHYIKAWDGCSRVDMKDEKPEDRLFSDRAYDSLLSYFCDEIGASQPKNVIALAMDIAKMNGLKVSELFKKYQG